MPNFQDKWYTYGKTWRSGNDLYWYLCNIWCLVLTVHVSKFQRRQCIGNFSAQHLNKFDMCSNFEVAILGIWFSSFLHAPSIFEASFKLILIISEVINCNLILKSQAFWTALWSTNRSMYALAFASYFNCSFVGQSCLLASLLYLFLCLLWSLWCLCNKCMKYIYIWFIWRFGEVRSCLGVLLKIAFIV